MSTKETLKKQIATPVTTKFQTSKGIYRTNMANKPWSSLANAIKVSFYSDEEYRKHHKGEQTSFSKSAEITRLINPLLWISAFNNTVQFALAKGIDNLFEPNEKDKNKSEQTAKRVKQVVLYPFRLITAALAVTGIYRDIKKEAEAHLSTAEVINKLDSPFLDEKIAAEKRTPKVAKPFTSKIHLDKVKLALRQFGSHFIKPSDVAADVKKLKAKITQTFK